MQSERYSAPGPTAGHVSELSDDGVRKGFMIDLPKLRSNVLGVDGYWRSLAVFNGYRLLVAVIFAVSALLLADRQVFPAIEPKDLLAVCLMYVLITGLGFVGISLQRPKFQLQLSVNVAIDVVFTLVLVHAAGGLKSGFALMLLITIAAAGLISRGRYALFHAALAAIGVQLESVFEVLYGDPQGADFLQAGLLSLGFFATAFLAYTLARYASASERLAIERGIDLANLAQVNQLVIRDMADGVVVIDDQDRIRSGNPRAEMLFGSFAADGMQHLAFYSVELTKALQRWRGDPGKAAEPLQSPRGNWQVQPRFIAIGGGQATVISLIDQSEQQKQVQQVKLAALGRLTASIAHEIRNPLSSINHAAELLQEDEDLSTGNARLLTIIRDNVQRLDRMVQEVLHLNRRDEAHVEPLAGAAYLGQFANEFSQIEKVPGEVLSLEIDTAQPMVFDRIHLHQVLWNLTRNAWRHCQKHAGSIRLCLSPAAIEGMLQLDIIDDGLGVDPAFQDQLFEPFFTTESKGTGLGLYIARQVCQANGASLDYVNVAPGGQFRIVMRGGGT
jgi:two-component system sensor histidine kinase PilS (NtrC family)